MSADAMTCRIADPSDALCIGVLAIQVFLDTYATAGIRPVLAREALGVYSPEAFTARLSSPTTHFVLAEHDGHLVGFAEVDCDRVCPVPAGGKVELVRLYVQRAFQGRGIGRLLLQQAERIAADAGSRALWLTAWVGNAKALAFYPAQGYADVGATGYLIEGQSYENRVFVKTPL